MPWFGSEWKNFQYFVYLVEFCFSGSCVIDDDDDD